MANCGSQVPYKKFNSGHLHAICEHCFHIFSMERNIVTNILTYCSWVNKNEKPSNKEKMDFFLMFGSCLSWLPQCGFQSSCNWPPLICTIKGVVNSSTMVYEVRQFNSRTVAVCHWGLESDKPMYSSTFEHVPTCVYMNHRPNELLVPKQQRK